MKVRQDLRAVRQGLAVYDDPGEWQGHIRPGDRHELDRPIPAVPRPQPKVVAVLHRDDPEAIMLQLVQPSIADRQSTGRAGRIKPGGWRRSRARGERINIAAL